MKIINLKLISLCVLITTIFATTADPAAAQIFSNNKEDAQEQNSNAAEVEGGYFDTLARIRNLENVLAAKEELVKFSQENPDNPPQTEIIENEGEIETKENRIAEINSEISEINNRENPDITRRTELINERRQLQTEISDLKERNQELVPLREAKELENQQQLENLEAEIAQIRTDIQSNKQISRRQLLDLAKRIGYFVGFIILALLFKKVAKRTINKNRKNMSQARKEVLIRVVNIVVFTLVALAIFAALFAQFANFLPFLALLGTGLAFAVRDVISSFLAWFFIGTNNGYKVGDLIEIGGARGRVLDVHLIHTIIQETGQRGPSGKIITIPNKKLFEEKLRNFSKMFRFTWVIFDFLLEKNSNVAKAKELLIEAINEASGEDMEEIRKNLPSLSRKYGFNEENIKPQILVDLEEKGIRLQVKFFCRLIKRHSLRSQVSEIFLAKVNKNTDVNLRFLTI